MQNKQYDTLVFTLRGQPVHNAHIEIIRQACAMAKQLIIVIGSAFQPRTFKNPWTSAEREIMLRTTIAAEVNTRDCNIVYEHNIDTIYSNTAWLIRMQTIADKHTQTGDRIAIIGHDKDSTTNYLEMFPQWGREEIPLIEPLNATDVRDLYFRRDCNMNFIRGVVPKSIFDILTQFRLSAEYEQVIREREFIEEYRKQYAGLPNAPTFVTADACVIQNGHILLIQRRSEPGKNLMALPGGFLNAATDTSLQSAAIRELREETGIKVPAPVLNGSITKSRVFDAIGRSARGRTITHCYVINLADGPLPKVRGNDDAVRAKFVPIGSIRREEMFEDHAEIIDWAIGK